MEESVELKRRRQREEVERRLAVQQGQPRTYIDDDGCEVTITASGHVFYNAADWY